MPELKHSKLVSWCILVGLLGAGSTVLAQESSTAPFSAPERSPWKEGVGEGFRKWANEVGMSLGAGFGMKALGSTTAHDWGIATVNYGTMLTGVVAPNRFYRGNLELLAEIWGAGQYRPDVAYAIGATPHLRYHFATGHRWVPFFDVGAGVTATDIRDNDLGSTFEFNLQTGAGLDYFLRDNLALSLQYRFIHLSDAGISTPNQGANTSNILLGLSWFF